MTDTAPYFPVDVVPPPVLDELVMLDGYPFPVFVSPGGEERGGAVAARAAETLDWLGARLPMPPAPPVFIVGPQQWEQVANFPVYGMPHAALDRVVVGQEAAAFWSAVTAAATRDVDLYGHARLQKIYGDDIDLTPFADLLVSHELTHLSHIDSQWDGPPPIWLFELTANLGLVGYVSEREPDQVVVLETAFEQIWAAPNAHWPVRSLQDIAQSLGGDAANYVWFEFGLLVLAKRLWEVAGDDALRQLVEILRGPARSFDEAVAVIQELDPWTAEALQAWPEFPARPES